MTVTPDQAPDGVELRFLPRPNTKLTGWQTWATQHPTGTYWESRRVIRPRLILIHTNAASVESHVDAAYNYAMSSQDATKPHYQVDRDGRAAKFLPSDRQGVCNYQADPFSISIETADLGYGTGRPGDVHFTAEQGEMVARIVAHESELWDIPIATPAQWNGEGVAAHTDPFSYPYWTKYQGKTCPGALKKADIRDWIMPRAIDLLFPPPPPTEDDMLEMIQPNDGDPAVFLRDGLVLTWVQGESIRDVLIASGVLKNAAVRACNRLELKAYELHGPIPATKTTAADFARVVT